MRRLIVVVSVVLLALNALATEKQKSIVESDSFFWIDVNVPYVDFEGTATAPGTSKAGSVGVAGGIAPFSDDIWDTDTAVQQFFKNLQFTMGLNAHRSANFDQLVGVAEVPVHNYFSCEDANGNFEYWRCFPCQEVSSGTGYCTNQNVYAREDVVSFIHTSLQGGVLVPLKLSENLNLAIGPEVSVLYIREGKVTSDLDKREKISGNVVARLEFDVGENWGLSATVRKSVAGPKADMANVGAYVKFR